MKKQAGKKIFRMSKGGLEPAERTVVQEYPLRLTVNEREIATLIASPHQLNFLVAGFLRNQGFVDSLDDFLTLGICHDFGDANVRLNRAIPESLKPTLTSGCGTGITFSLPEVAAEQKSHRPERVRFTPEAVFNLMKDLHRQAENYRDHGGIHSAAVGDGERLLLYAEDIGRHNTLDRIAGEAFFKKVDLAGKMLVTSGRVSTEMVAKAARLGIALIASRTSPTDMAIRMSEEAGITLVGYLRGESFEVYSHAEALAAPVGPKKIAAWGATNRSSPSTARSSLSTFTGRWPSCSKRWSWSPIRHRSITRSPAARYPMFTPPRGRWPASIPGCTTPVLTRPSWSPATCPFSQAK